MVLMRTTSALALTLGAVAASAGCKQSLFDDGSGDSPEPVGDTCPAECLGDAARDFDAASTNTAWRYVEDRRDRTWAPMSAIGKRAVGADAANAMTTCAATPSAAACDTLPGALLVSTSGATSAADPALELTIADKRVVRIGLRALAPTTGPDQQVLIYRNSREDLLFTGALTAGVVFEQVLSADTLPGDRLLVAFAPASGGSKDIGVELFLSDVGATSSCQVGLTFNEATGTSLPNGCGAAFSSLQYRDVGDDTPLTPTLIDGPYPELGKAGSLAPGAYYVGTEVPDKRGEVTLQFWLKTRTIDGTYGSYVYSDHDLDNAGGISVDMFTPGRAIFESLVCTKINGGTNGYAGAFVDYPTPTAWHFARLSYKDGKMAVCLDGKRLFDYTVPTNKVGSLYPPHIGKNVKWSPGAFFDGAVDDLRLLTTALPCP